MKFEVKLLYYCDYSVFFAYDLRGVGNPRTVGASRGGMGVGLVEAQALQFWQKKTPSVMLGVRL